LCGEIWKMMKAPLMRTLPGINSTAKMFHAYPDGEVGKHAITHYKVVERFNYVTLVECTLETGRTHQIRVHMKYAGHTLFNDWEYGGDKILKRNSVCKV